MKHERPEQLGLFNTPQRYSVKKPYLEMLTRKARRVQEIWFEKVGAPAIDFGLAVEVARRYTLPEVVAGAEQMMSDLRLGYVKIGPHFYPDMESVFLDVLDSRLAAKLAHEEAERQQPASTARIIPFQRTGTA